MSGPEKTTRKWPRTSHLGTSLTSKYLIALGLIAILTSLSAGGLRFFAGDQDTVAKFIDLSGRQRMLAQRILYYATLATSEAELRKRRQAQRGLKAAIRIMERQHRMLIQKWEGFGVPAHASKELRELYFDSDANLDDMIGAYLSHARAIASANADELPALKVEISHVRNWGASVLPHSLHDAVQAFSNLTHERVKRVERLELLAWSGTILGLILVGLFIFRPMVHRIVQETLSLQEAVRERERATEEAVAANSAKSEFLAMMSHELRTPLNAIIGFSGIIKDQSLGPDYARYRAYAGDIYDSGQHLLALINDILDLSKVESGKDELYEEDIDLFDIIHSVGRLVRMRAVKDGVSLAYDIQEDAPLLRADSRKLKQVLVNLLTNAIKFSHQKGTVTLKAWCKPESGFVLQVQDHGIGMNPEDIPKAMMLFGQVDSGLDRRFEGTGLGLSLTKSLVEQHGGTFDLQSQPGVGTTATVRLPATRLVPRPVSAESEAEISQMAS